jgi:cell division protease FtsH
MCATLGGRAAEQVIFGKISTGALSDLERVTKQAYAMVSIYGLNDKVGNLSYYDMNGGEFSFQKPYSEKRAEVIDDEVSKIIEESYKRAVKILTENKDKLVKLGEKLLEKEVIFKEDLEEIFGKRQWIKEEESFTDAARVEEPKKESSEAKDVKSNGATETKSEVKNENSGKTESKKEDLAEKKEKPVKEKKPDDIGTAEIPFD